jgi:8-oxo-dGTP diphosphatase
MTDRLAEALRLAEAIHDSEALGHPGIAVVRTDDSLGVRINFQETVTNTAGKIARLIHEEIEERERIDTEDVTAARGAIGRLKSGKDRIVEGKELERRLTAAGIDSAAEAEAKTAGDPEMQAHVEPHAQHRYVVGFLVSDDGSRIALMRKERPAWQRGKWNGIGGKIEGDETPKAAMAREFREETGLLIESWQRRVELRGSDWTVYFFLARAGSRTVASLSGQEDELISYFSTDRLHPDAIPNLHWLVPLCMDEQIAPCVITDISFPDRP